MTERLFLDDPTLARVDATVLSSAPEGSCSTAPFSTPGRRPAGDVGMLWWEGGEIAITDTVKGEGDQILHLPHRVCRCHRWHRRQREIDWDRRHKLMRMHTAMHLLCSLIKGAAVTEVLSERTARAGFRPAQPAAERIHRGRPERPDRGRSSVRIEWVDEAVLDTDPGLVRTMSVQPRAHGRLRLMRIGEDSLVDLQPCGGTTSPAPRDRPDPVVKIENKGKQNPHHHRAKIVRVAPNPHQDGRRRATMKALIELADSLYNVGM